MVSKQKGAHRCPFRSIIAAFTLTILTAHSTPELLAAQPPEGNPLEDSIDDSHYVQALTQSRSTDYFAAFVARGSCAAAAEAYRYSSSASSLPIVAALTHATLRATSNPIKRYECIQTLSTFLVLSGIQKVENTARRNKILRALDSNTRAQVLACSAHIAKSADPHNALCSPVVSRNLARPVTIRLAALSGAVLPTTPTSSSEAALNNYLAETACSSTKTTSCLSPVIFQGQTSYLWRKDGTPQVYPHFLRTLLELELAALAEQKSIAALTRYRSQYTFMLISAITRTKLQPDTGMPIVSTGWESNSGHLSAFVQAEFAKHFLDAANTLWTISGSFAAGSPNQRLFLSVGQDLFDISQRLLNAFDLRGGVRSGGVQSPKRLCGPTASQRRGCYFYTGHNIPDSIGEHYILNKATVSLRELTKIWRLVHQTRMGYQGFDKSTMKFALVERMAPFMLALAFSDGPTFSTPDRAPALKHFMSTRFLSHTTPFYWLAYSYNMTGRVAENNSKKIGGYGDHSINTLAYALREAERSPVPYYSNFWISVASAELLSYLEPSGDPQPLGAPNSTFTLYQAFRTSVNNDVSLRARVRGPAEDSGTSAIDYTICTYLRGKFDRIRDSVPCESLPH